MRNIINKLAYVIFMRVPLRWTDNRFGLWILSRAGEYANPRWLGEK